MHSRIFGDVADLQQIQNRALYLLCLYIFANSLSVEVMHDNLVLTEMKKTVTSFDALA